MATCIRWTSSALYHLLASAAVLLVLIAEIFRMSFFRDVPIPMGWGLGLQLAFSSDTTTWPLLLLLPVGAGLGGGAGAIRARWFRIQPSPEAEHTPMSPPS